MSTNAGLFFEKVAKTGMQDKNALQKNLFSLMINIREKMRAATKGVDEQMSPVQIQILQTLVAEGPMPQNALVDTLSKDKSQIARLVKTLEQNGLVLRQQSEEDRRVHIVAVASHVKERVALIMARERQLIADLFADVTEQDMEVFNRVLVALNEKSTQT